MPPAHVTDRQQSDFTRTIKGNKTLDLFNTEVLCCCDLVPNYSWVSLRSLQTSLAVLSGRERLGKKKDKDCNRDIKVMNKREKGRKRGKGKQGRMRRSK